MRRSACLLLAATAGLVPAVAAAPASAAPDPAAAKPTHVAIVIAGDGVACVTWHPGITGDDVLNAVATVRYRPTDGLITQIDGTPKNNTADETHYWSYWHNTGSGWTYSTVGASAYQPKAGTVEGWRFVNGKPTATPPPLKSYARICHETTSAPGNPPATSTAPRRSPAGRSSPATTSATQAPSGAQRGSDGSTTASGAHIGRPSRPATSTAAVPSSASTTTPAGTGTSAAPTGADDLPTLSARPAADRANTDSGSALPTVLGGVLVLVLGAGAWLAARRRNS